MVFVRWLVIVSLVLAGFAGLLMSVCGGFFFLSGFGGLGNDYSLLLLAGGCALAGAAIVIGAVIGVRYVWRNRSMGGDQKF